jgi:DNA-directed RNA polymerase
MGNPQNIHGLLNFWEGEPLSSEGKNYLYIYGANNHNENSISK